MNVTKKVLGELEKCYCLAKLHYKGEEHFLVAAEKVDRCMLFDTKGNYEETVWDGPGGVMTMVQVPGTDGQFLSTRKFYSPNDSAEASIVIATPRGKDDWEVRTLVDLPFVHRFDILESGGEHYLIACCLKSGHEFKNDWSMPGKVFAAKLPEDLSSFHDGHQLEMTVIKEGMLKNHGYTRYTDKAGKVSSVVSCEQGVYQFFPPTKERKEWKIETLLEQPASDAVLVDFDQDGEDELAVLSPFHGNELLIYKKKAGVFEKVYEYPEKLDFLHAIYGGMLCGKPRLVVGHREDERYLLSISYEEGEYRAQVLDKGCGVANVLLINSEGKDAIVATNREINEIAMYVCSD